MSPTSLKRNIAGAAMIGAPVLLLAADTLISFTDEMLVWTVVSKLGFLLFAAAVLGLVHLLRDRKETYGLVAGAVAFIGLLDAVTVTSINHAAWALAHSGLDATTAQATHDVLRDVFWWEIMIPLPGPAFPLGLFLLGVGLYLARAVAPWQAIALAVGAILFPVARIGSIVPALFVSDAALIIGLGSIGLTLLRRAAAHEGAEVALA